VVWQGPLRTCICVRSSLVLSRATARLWALCGASWSVSWTCLQASTTPLLSRTLVRVMDGTAGPEVEALLEEFCAAVKASGKTGETARNWK
jgi:hypothetical protein